MPSAAAAETAILIFIVSPISNENLFTPMLRQLLF